MTTYYADGDLTTGADDGSSWADAWRTLAQATGKPLVPGDIVNYRGTFEETLTLATAGTEASPISWINHAAKIDGQSARSYCLDLNGKSYNNFLTNAPSDFLELTGATSYGMRSNAHFFEARNIKSYSNNRGVYIVSASADVALINFEIYNNTLDGLFIAGGSWALFMAMFDIHDNGAAGAWLANNCYPIFFACLLRGNTNQGIHDDSSRQAIILNSVFYDNGDDGIECENAAYMQVYNSIFKDNGAYGISCASSRTTQREDHNCFHGNVSGARNNIATGSKSIAMDPLFVNPGAGDFRIQAGSPCIGKGMPDEDYLFDGEMDMGALQRVMGSGGFSPLGATGSKYRLGG